MDQAHLPQFLTAQHAAFLHTVRSLSDQDYLLAKSGKWSAGQQLDHIRRSVQPVTLAFGLPAWTLRLLFGKANRVSRSYEALVEKYHQKLAAGYGASGRYVPPATAELADRKKIAATLENQVLLLNRRLTRYSEQRLDTLLLPHPLLGKLTLREMVYFTAYHVQHHHRLMERNLAPM